jgi:uncharacterized membrane protein
MARVDAEFGELRSDVRHLREKVDGHLQEHKDAKQDGLRWKQGITLTVIGAVVGALPGTVLGIIALWRD